MWFTILLAHKVNILCSSPTLLTTKWCNFVRVICPAISFIRGITMHVVWLMHWSKYHISRVSFMAIMLCKMRLITYYVLLRVLHLYCFHFPVTKESVTYCSYIFQTRQICVETNLQFQRVAILYSLWEFRNLHVITTHDSFIILVIIIQTMIQGTFFTKCS